MTDVMEKEGFVVDGSIVIEVTMNVAGGNGDRFRVKRAKPHFFSPSKFSDVTLSVEGKNIHVSKQILAHASPYFEALFFIDFNESQKKEIKLDEVSAPDFMTALELIYGCADLYAINDDNVENLLKIADRFDIPKIMNSVEDAMDELERPVHAQLLLSQQYQLDAVQESCLNFYNERQALDVVSSDSYKDFSNELKGEIRKKLNEFLLPSDRIEKNEDRIVTGKIRIRLDNVKNLTNYGVKSAVKRINGYPWQLKAFRDETTNNLVVHILCKKSEESPCWYCKVEGEVKLINHNDDTASLSKNFDEILSNFNEIYYSDEPITIFQWNQFIGNSNFVDDGSIEVEVTINVKGRSGERFRRKPLTDFFSHSKFSDVVFVAEGKKMYASTQILANVSSHFKNLIYGSDKCKEKEVVLYGVSSEEFLEMLEMIYDVNREAKDSTVKFLLKIADRFEITSILDKAESLLYRSKLSLHEKLRLSDEYRLEVLKMKCLRAISDVNVVEEVKNSDSYIHYSSGLKDGIINRMIQLLKGETTDESWFTHLFLLIVRLTALLVICRSLVQNYDDDASLNQFRVPSWEANSEITRKSRYIRKLL
ncbi:hypothetical protein PENTCL1PPCAC_2170 [Pristionchus entomophagus]|uniref:BTB domain-containing protein n=1 Tax=Pristionchus entomophagus TaxID=358040 RepID=A0AAV5SIK5_9BILA|nr:hypothetical protein PENTCL1PPCAC_2170 [Pristionchus entomophagus]